MNKRTMKKGLAIVLALVMVFAMTATAFASTNTDISVNVTIDTRTLSRSAVFMSKTDGTALGTTPGKLFIATYLTISTIMSQVGRKELMSMTMYRQHTI